MHKSASAPCLLTHAAASGSRSSSAKLPSLNQQPQDRSSSRTHKSQGVVHAYDAAALAAAAPTLLDTFLSAADEAGFGASRGLAASECFALYGFGDEAPPVKALSADLSPEERTAAELESKLAVCLSLPTTAQERNVGELLQQEVRRAGMQSELDTQLRFMREIDREVVVEARDELEAMYTQGTAHRLRRRRGRRRDQALDQLLGLEDEDSRRAHARTAPQDQPDLEAWTRLYGPSPCQAHMLTLDEGDAGEPGLPTGAGLLFSAEIDSDGEAGREGGPDAELAAELALTQLIGRLGSSKASGGLVPAPRGLGGPSRGNVVPFPQRMSKSLRR